MLLQAAKLQETFLFRQGLNMPVPASCHGWDQLSLDQFLKGHQLVQLPCSPAAGNAAQLISVEISLRRR